MSQTTKPKQILSVIVCGRKLKGKKLGRFVTIPLNVAERLDIDPGDLLELEVKKITKPEIQNAS